MIVLVLGAGASCHYSFPSGPALKRQVVEALRDVTSTLAHDIRSVLPNIDDDQMLEFSKALDRHGHLSIDAFLQTPSYREKYYNVAKVAMAAVLLEKEQPHFVPPTPCWYRYFVQEVIPADPEGFEDSGIRIVTFNFDRSFKHAITVGAAGTWNVSPEVAGRVLAKALPISHVHGALQGEYGQQWRKSPHPRNTLFRKIDPELIRLSAQHISLIGDTVEHPGRALAKEWVGAARAVLFLGFGYHDFALARLGLLGVAGDQRRFSGTTLGLDEGRVAHLRQGFGHLHGASEFRACSIDEFLRASPDFHNWNLRDPR